MKLTDLKRGESATIVSIDSSGELRKRLVDLGIHSGQIIKLKRCAPLGDPQEYRVNCCNSIAIRKIDAENIIVEKREDEKETEIEKGKREGCKCSK